METDLKDRVVLVTGGYGILGTAVAKAFAAEGDKVARIDYSATATSSDPSFLEIGNVDLTDAAAAQGAIETVVGHWGRIDVLINVAGGFIWELVRGGNLQSWRRMFDMNVMTTITICQTALPFLLKSHGARIVNIGAMGALTAATGMAPYAAAKAGVHRLTESLAAELSGEDITINALMPSIIDTPTNRRDMPDADFRQWVKPEAIAEIAIFLASPSARSISGALIPATRGSVGF